MTSARITIRVDHQLTHGQFRLRMEPDQLQLRSYAQLLGLRLAAGGCRLSVAAGNLREVASQLSYTGELLLEVAR